MPPKKKEEAKKKVLLGRPGNTLRMGIVGMPNVGKSTTFNILTKLNVPAENYPFCTKDPNNAQVSVPDAHFNKLCEMFKPSKMSAATLNITDIAGLVKGASEGNGLGNAFLSHIQGVDGIYHVVRVFEDPEIVHFEGEVNPITDLETIYNELLKKDLQHLDDRIAESEKAEKRSATGKEKVLELKLLNKARESLEKGIYIKDVEWTVPEIEYLNTYQLLTAKPIVYLFNMGIEDYKKKYNPNLKKMIEWVKGHGGGPIIPYSATYEEMVEAAENKEAFCKEEGAPSVLNKIIRVGYNSLNLIHFYTILSSDFRCWTIRAGTVAKKAAGCVHTDMEEGFICVDVIKYEDIAELGSESAVKAAGRMRQQGKDYEVEDGDILFVKFNPPKHKK